MRNWIEIVNPLVEAIQVFHGSPHELTVFSTEHIGKGEGHQAYGWGLYFAAERGVADYYQTTLTSGVKFRGQPVDLNADKTNAISDVAYRMVKDRIGAAPALADAIEAAKDNIGWMEPRNDRRVSIWQDRLAELEKMAPHDFELYRTSEGRMYTVTIPDGPYLFWDKPFSEQPKATKTMLRKMRQLYTDYLPHCIKDDDSGEVIYKCLGNFNRNDRRTADEYKQASLDLLAYGIVGIAYLDEESREVGEGTLNYVIFDGAMVEIHQG